MKTNILKQLFIIPGLILAVNSYADSSLLAKKLPQEFYVGTWTASVPDGLGTLKSDFPSQGIYKVRFLRGVRGYISLQTNGFYM